jgi:TrmH family RNA methyltransferase
MISSSQNSRIKLARALAGSPKEREAGQAFIAEGVRLVEEALAAGWPFRFVFHTDELRARGVELLKRIKQQKIETEEVQARLLASISDTETSQGILAVLEYQPIPMPQAVDFVLVLDAIREPGNLGTLLRTADAAGVQAVVLAPETVDAFAPKVVRAGMGAHFRLPIQSMDWPGIGRLVESMNLGVCLADMRGTACWKTDFRPPLALIIGGEAEGASEQARNVAKQTVRIPMQGKAESLNAAVAGSILMFEVVRQRNARG